MPDTFDSARKVTNPRRGRGVSSRMSNQPPFENVVLIVADALRYDKLGINGADLHTPNIDAFAAEYTNFDSAFACSNVTDVSVSTIMSGKYPLEHGVLNQGSNVTDKEKQYAEGTTFLAERLSENGFRTVGIEPILERWHRNGFDTYLPERNANEEHYTGQHPLVDVTTSIGEVVYDAAPEILQKRIYPLVRDFTDPKGVYEYDAKWVTNSALEEFDADSASSFYFLHYWDTHTPYNPPAEYIDDVTSRIEYDETPLDQKIAELGVEKSVSKESLKQKIRDKYPETVADITARYDASVEYLDEWIGKLLDGLRERGELNDTLVIFTSDHGESLTEHGILFDHHGLYEETIHVPLVMGGGQIPDSEISGLVQHYDIVPTILDSLNIEAKPMIGGSLLKATHTQEGAGPPYRYAFAEEHHTQENRAIRTDNHKLIKAIGNQVCRYCDIKHSDGDQLFDLNEDPAETQNKLHTSPKDAGAIKEELEAAFTEWEEHLKRPDRNVDEASYTEDSLNDRLEALGYK